MILNEIFIKISKPKLNIQKVLSAIIMLIKRAILTCSIRKKMNRLDNCKNNNEVCKRLTPQRELVIPLLVRLLRSEMVLVSVLSRVPVVFCVFSLSSTCALM